MNPGHPALGSAGASPAKAIWNGAVIAQSDDVVEVVVDGQRNVDAAWYYPTPKPQARQVADRVAFWKGVTIER